MLFSSSLFLLLSTFVAAVPVATPPPNSTPYTVLYQDTCDKIASAHGMTVTSFRALNPGLNAACFLFENQVVNIKTVRAIHKVASKDTCVAIAAAYAMPLHELYSLNPQINQQSMEVAACTNLKIGEAINVQTSLTTYAVVAGDTCINISGAHGMLLDVFMAANKEASTSPAINAKCTNLAIGEIVCVAKI